MKKFYNNTLIGGAFSKALRVIALLCVLMGVSSSAWWDNIKNNGAMCLKYYPGSGNDTWTNEINLNSTISIDGLSNTPYIKGAWVKTEGGTSITYVMIKIYIDDNFKAEYGVNYNGDASHWDRYWEAPFNIPFETSAGQHTIKIEAIPNSGSTGYTYINYNINSGGGGSSTTYYLCGGFNSWNETSTPFSNGSCTVSLESGQTYEFKVKDADNWYGNTGTITGTITGWTFSLNTGNCKITTAAAGNYVFTWHEDTKKLDVTYPTGGSGGGDEEIDGSESFDCESIEIWCRTSNGNTDMWCYGWTNNNTELFGGWRGSKSDIRGVYDGNTYAVWQTTGHDQINVIFSSDVKNAQTGDLTGYKKGNRVIFTLNENYNGVEGDVKQVACGGGSSDVVNNGTIYLDISSLQDWASAGAVLKVKITNKKGGSEEIELTQCATDNKIFFVDEIIDLNSISKVNMLRYDDKGSAVWNQTGDITFNPSTNCVKLTSWNGNYANYSLTGYSGDCGVATSSPVLIANEASVADDGKTVTLSGYLQETFCEAITEYGFIYCGGSATKGCTPTKNSPRLKVTPSTQLYRGEKFTVTTVLPVNTTYGYKAYIMVGEIMYISAETGFFTLGDCTNKPTNLSTITYTVDASLGEEFADPCTLTFGNLQKAIDHLKNANSPELGLYQYVDKVGSSYNLKQPVVMNVVYYDDTPDDDTKAYIYRGTTSVGKHAGENAPKNSNLIENINLDGAEPSHTLTIKAGTKVAKPWIHHIVLRKSKNIVLDSLCIYSDPNGVGDNAIEMDINVATKGEGWNALNNQTGTGIKDNYLDNANIMVKNCMIGSDGFTGMHISSYNGVTFKNNDFESVFDKGSNNDINYGASAKFLYCKNIKFIENNFRGDHATLMWIQEVQNMLVMNNVFWNTNKYQQKQGTHVPAAMRVVTQWNPTKNIGFYYNTYFFADNGETWTESKYNFLHFSHTVSGGSGSYNLGTMYFKYNNCYSYDPDCPGDEDINISGYENNFCPNNFWSEYDKINSKSTSVFAFGCSGNTFTNVKTQVCETSATGPASLIVNRTAMNLGSAPTGDELLGFTLTTDEARGDRYYSNVRPVGSGWTYGAYQSKAEAPTDVIYWLGLSDDWDDRNNWEYYAPEDPTDPESPMIRQRVSCVNTFSEDLKVVIEEIGSLEISGGRKWPLIPSSFDADERRTNSKADVPQNEQVSAGASGKFASIIELEYGAGIIGVENLGDGIYYDEASMSFTAPRKQWILVGTVVKPFDENGNPRNIKSGDYFITGQTPHVYMHKAEIVGDKAKWDETFTSLETEVEPTTVFAIQVPDQYGKYKLPARYYNTSNKTNFNPDEPIEYGKYAGSKGPFNGEFVNQSSVPTYTGLTAGQPVLLNNSYPANIDAKVLESVSGGTVQYYNYESGTFLNTSSTSEQVLLKPQHGFIFTPAVGENSLTIENVEGMFVNGNTRSRSLEVEVPTLSINVVNANTGVAFGNAVVRYDELLANGEESASNVEKVFSPNQDAPELYIIANDKMYSRLDVNPSTTVIPLGVRLKQDMNIKFIKEYFNGFSYATLVDTYTDKETDLLRNSYITETLVAGDIEGRFFLNLQLADDSNEEDDDDNVSTEVEEDDATNGAINIFVDESNNIRVATNGVELQTIYVSDMAGKTMKYNVRGYAATLNLPVAQGVYTLNVIGDKANRTEKVILK